jgi:hypothetical protein
MAVDAEAIWTALETRLREETGSFKTISRRRVAQLGVEQIPALFIFDDEGEEIPSTDAHAPGPAWKLTGDLAIFARTPDTDSAPTAKLNDLIKEVREALETQTTEVPFGRGYAQHYTNLGGAIDAMSIVKVEKGAGELSGTSVARLSVEILAR